MLKEAVKHNYAEIGMSCHKAIHQNFPQMEHVVWITLEVSTYFKDIEASSEKISTN